MNMAKADWCKVSPVSGEEGLTEVSISADPFTGRVSRSTEVLLTASDTGGSSSVAIEVTQKPKAEFISVLQPEDGKELAGGVQMSQMFNIKSNCEKIKVTAEQRRESFGTYLPYPFWLYDVTSVNGEKGSDGSGFLANVSGERGASSIELDCLKVGEETEYTCSFPFSIQSNSASEPRYIRITLSNEDESVSQTITLQQTAGTPSISADPVSVELEQDGSAKSVDVESNADWSAS